MGSRLGGGRHSFAPPLLGEAGAPAKVPLGEEAHGEPSAAMRALDMLSGAEKNPPRAAVAPCSLGGDDSASQRAELE